jgi:hypothetical protein
VVPQLRPGNYRVDLGFRPAIRTAPEIELTRDAVAMRTPKDIDSLSSYPAIAIEQGTSGGLPARDLRRLVMRRAAPCATAPLRRLGFQSAPLALAGLYHGASLTWDVFPA